MLSREDESYYHLNWTIEKDFDIDYDGFSEFNEHYNLKINSTMDVSKDGDVDHYAHEIFDNLIEAGFTLKI